MPNFNKILRGDRVIWIIALLLGIISLLAVYSAGSSLAVRNFNGDTGKMLMKHASTLFLGYVFMYIAYRINYLRFAPASKILIWICAGALLYTLFFGRNLNNASRSISLMGFSFQPSEWAKIFLITYIARELVLLKEDINNFKLLLKKIILPTMTIVGLIFTENLSTALLLLASCVALLLVGRVQFKHLVSLGLIGIGMLTAYILFDQASTTIINKKREKAYLEEVAQTGDNTLEFKKRMSRVETWKQRVLTMTESQEEETDPFDDHHYQQTYAKIAVASGSVFGKGAGKSEQRNFLPHPYSDFIFAIIVEEYGIVGAAIVILIYIILLTRVMRIVTKKPISFGAYMSFGLCFMLIMQAMINMGVSIGLLPVTGQTLPLVSMGGSSMMATGFLLGMILSVTRSIEEEENAQIEEIENSTIANTDTNERSVESCD